MGRILRKPREPSVVGIMLFSALVVLSASDPPLYAVVFWPFVLLLHILSFDSGFDAARRRDARTLLVTAALNVLPYTIIIAIVEFKVYVLGIILALLLLLISTIMYWLKPKNPWSYITGSIVPTLPALSMASIFYLGKYAILLWLFYTIYVTAEAAYIESRLPFRSFNPWISVAIWAPALPIAYTYNSLLLLAAIEPTVRYLYNSIRGPFKVAYDEIRRLGRRTLFKTIIFTVAIILINILG
jgi:hypothetical protein